MKNLIRCRWKLSELHPFSLKKITERKPGYPPADMHEAVHLGLYLAGHDMHGRIGSTEFSFVCGETWLSAPWEPHSFYSLDDCIFILFTFDVRTMEHLLGPYGERFRRMLRTPAPYRMKLLRKGPDFSKVLFSSSSPTAIWLSFGAWFAEWCANCENEELPAPQWDDRLAPALEGLCSVNAVPLTLPDAARLCRLSVSQFSKLFHAAFGLSFGAYELRYRLQCVAAELAGGDLIGKIIAEKYGFYDKSHLSRSFLKEFGVTPSAYRKNSRECAEPERRGRDYNFY